jgi:AcrR family transcriptional regulator
MQDRSEITRGRILQESFQLFLQKGYDTTGVAQICEAAQVSKGAFYHHFPSKHDVFLTILDQWTDALEKKFVTIQSSPENIPTKIQKMSDSLNEIFYESHNIPIFLEFWVQSMRDKSVSARTIAPYFRFLRYFEELIQQGITDGSFSTKIDSKSSARLLMSYAMGTILQCMIEPNLDWQSISKENIHSLISGMIKE